MLISVQMTEFYGRLGFTIRNQYQDIEPNLQFMNARIAVDANLNPGAQKLRAIGEWSYLKLLWKSGRNPTKI